MGVFKENCMLFSKKNEISDQKEPKEKQNVKIKIKSIKKIQYMGIQFYNLLGSIFYVIVGIFFILFFILNAEYKSSVYLIYRTYKNVSVSTVMLISFLLGNIFMLLVVIQQIHKRRKVLKVLQKKENEKEEAKLEKIQH